jgi:hypothetical protein
MHISAKAREYELKRDDGTTRRSQLLDDIIPELLCIPINLKLKVPRSFQESLKKFVKEHGLDPKFDVRKILEYGLMEESDVELERLEMERLDPSSEVYSKSAVTKFKTYENFVYNKSRAQGLPFLVSENESLRRVLHEKGLVDSPESKWTKEKIDDFQRKYVFGNKSTEKDEHEGKTEN